MSDKIKEAIHILSQALKTDQDYYYGWQSNIAVQFQDEYKRSNNLYKNSDDIHEISNNAAKNFLNLLINK